MITMTACTKLREAVTCSPSWGPISSRQAYQWLIGLRVHFEDERRKGGREMTKMVRLTVEHASNGSLKYKTASNTYPFDFCSGSSCNIDSLTFVEGSRSGFSAV
jgi:hypothetical protein